MSVNAWRVLAFGHLAMLGAVLPQACAGPVRLPFGASPTPSPSATASTSPTPLPSLTPTATPSPTLHPLQVAWLAERSYPASALSVEESLPPGSNYDRQVVSYRSDGLKIRALLTIPRGPAPATGWPVIIFNHGYIPPRQYRTTERYVAYVDAFARAGYIVLKSDYRGHGSSEGEPGGGYGRPDYTVDVLHALSAARALPQADPERVGMWGHSMGGYITLRSMVVTDTVKAGVIWAGVVASYPDLLSRWRRPPSSASAPPTSVAGWRNGLRLQFGSPEENPVFWDSLSANSFLQRLSGPLELHHGSADSSVPLEFSEILVEQAKVAGRPVDLFIYPGDDHNLSRNLALALNRSVDFFDEQLKAPTGGAP